MKAFLGIQINLSGALDLACNNTRRDAIVPLSKAAIGDTLFYFPGSPGFKNTRQQHFRTS